MAKHILIARECSDCGGALAARLFENPPTDEQKNLLRKELGNMYCIKVAAGIIHEDGTCEMEDAE